MKKTLNITIWIIVLLFSYLLSAQEFEGSWTGYVQGMPLIFEIENSSDAYIAKMQSPKQSKAFLPMTTTVVEGTKITMTLDTYKIKYEGELKDGKIVGIFAQGAGSFAMDLEKKAYIEEKLNRPQEPKAPFPYKAVEVSFMNSKAGDITLAGTLTLPNDVKKPPVAILISGSGPQDRNEELLGHKSFLVIAHHLTQKGIAVLRVDDRGVAQSQGTQKGATSEDFATDVEAAIAYLKTRKDINKKKIGLIGHSEGGLIAPIVIANNKKDVAFFISLAGTGLRGDKVLLPQMRKGAMLQGAPTANVDFDINIMDGMFKKIRSSQTASNEELQKELEKIVIEKTANAPESLKAKYSKDYITAITSQFSDNWMRFFLNYDPAANLKKVKCPVLALNGSLDYQVIPEINLPALESRFKEAGNKDVTVKELPGLNHLFQNAQTGSFAEYEKIEETFDPETLDLISSWINERF